LMPYWLRCLQAGDQFNHQLNPVNFMEVEVTCINSINPI